MRNTFLYLLFFLSLFIVIGCGSKKKSIQNDQVRIEQKTSVNEKEKEKSSSEKTVSESQSNKEIVKNQDQDFSGEVNDPSKPAVIIKEVKDGKEVTTYENFKNVKHKTTNSESESNKNSNTEGTEKSNLEKESTVEKKDDNFAFQKSKNVEASKKTFKIPWYIWLILILYAGISLYRKSINPIKWF